ncbi:MAG: sodium:proton exchanger [Candidatus Doudnabacteria bacterium CG10_big_fil_rev_8_21_14_0_10_42_18]|uniref:Sodium:proton exchanger n=1 Tax=Candidatus Doudnabacteria bacterium CG10_big_fil_rev_8_21_14_0_10_42_18 TaxID=1974552 RepID=A0A2H0VD05_9BACT|nr:MAG: sodium:proton exchanger [Candidatus Doudnabacteria bacterium CG10_big_fil_rev_8_21_14_0_10_42_18]
MEEFKLFYEITAVLVIAGLIAMLVSMLKQPSIIAFILTGLVVGPFGYVQLHAGATLDVLGQIGIALLLFMVGLELNFKQIKQLGKTALITGFGQIIFTATIGYFIVKLLGFSSVAALYIAIALTFSSTIIVVKLLGEKRDLQSLYARICVGFLIVQDFVALGILVILGGSGSGSSDPFRSLPSWQFLLTSGVKILALVLILIYISKFIFPKFLSRFEKSDELLLIFSMGWALGLAAFMSLPVIGFSLEVGAFVAGLALANSQVHYEISARIKSLRDFFIVIFFVVFGTKLVFTGVGALILPAILLSLFVLIGNPFIVMFIMGGLGYKPRTSFFAAVTVAQISEFSFVVVALGNRLGHVSDAVLGLVTLVGIITITVSSYMILYSRQLYEFLRVPLSWFDFKNGSAESKSREGALKNHIVLIGANRLGSHLINSLEKLKKPLIIVDFNPHVAKHYARAGHNVICGDITDPYIHEQINLEDASLVISTVPGFDDNLALLSSVKKLTWGKKRKPKLIFAAQDEYETRELYDKEIDYVISPHFIGGLHLAKILQEDFGNKTLKKLREKHLRAIDQKTA